MSLTNRQTERDEEVETLTVSWVGFSISDSYVTHITFYLTLFVNNVIDNVTYSPSPEDSTKECETHIGFLRLCHDPLIYYVRSSWTSYEVVHKGLYGPIFYDGPLNIFYV